MIKKIVEDKMNFNLENAKKATKKYRTLQRENANPHSIERWYNERETCIFIAKICESILNEASKQEGHTQMDWKEEKKEVIYE